MSQPQSSCSCGQSADGPAPSRAEFQRLERQLQSLEHRFGMLARLTGEVIGAAQEPAAAGGGVTAALSGVRLAARATPGSGGRNLGGDDAAKLLTRIIGGVPSAAGTFPECALLEIALPNGRTSLCSGVLVGRRVVLSAAHCAQASSITVHLACSSLDDIRAGQAESIAAKKWIVHPDYRPGNRPAINDLLLIILSTEARTAPVKVAEAAELAAQKEVTLVGFGSAHLDANSASAGTKRQVVVPLTAVRRAPGDDLDQQESFFGFESDSEFVAGQEGFDTCQGDSGGPVYLLDAEGTRLACGLTSRYALNNGRQPGNLCGSGGIYTRIDHFWPWIKATAKQHLRA